MAINIDPSFYQLSRENQALMYGTTDAQNQVAISQGYEQFIAGGGTPASMAPTPGAAAAAAAITGNPSASAVSADPYNTYDSVTGALISSPMSAGQIGYEQTLGYVYWHGKMKRQTNITMGKVIQAWSGTKTPGELGKALAVSIKAHPQGGFILKTRDFLRALA